MTDKNEIENNDIENNTLDELSRLVLQLEADAHALAKTAATVQGQKEEDKFFDESLSDQLDQKDLPTRTH
jgi:hypothetical protein